MNGSRSAQMTGRRMKEKRLAAGGPGLAALAFANCAMILENAIVMPDKYINEMYGSDAKMCKVAEQYFDLGVRILRETPEDFPVEEITIGRTDGGEYVPGLVHCKDCRHWHPEDGDCEELAKHTGALDYCSFGLNKEGEDE